MLQTMIQALNIGMTIIPDHLGGNFTEEEKEFMIQTALLEHKWRKGKRAQSPPKIQNEIETARTTVLKNSFAAPEEPTVAILLQDIVYEQNHR